MTRRKSTMLVTRGNNTDRHSQLHLF